VKRPTANGETVETLRYAVPVLDLEVRLGELTAGAGDDRVLPAPEIPSFDPVPDTVPVAPVRSIVDQAATAGTRTRAPRSNAAAPLLATGRRPRTAAQAATRSSGVPATNTEEVGSAQATVGAPDPVDQRKLHADLAKAFPDAERATVDRYRHALVILATQRRETGPVTSSSDLDDEERLRLSKFLVDVKAGRASVTDGPDGVEIRNKGGKPWVVDVERVTVLGPDSDDAGPSTSKESAGSLQVDPAAASDVDGDGS
jgi:hypothetical protein